ncbi:MAG: NAD(P)/FAD-dependent oxidoreductase [Acidobacteria bacterium]|nr:MAG: NAD(P)/FAD-dependent oxidoreductase [Acidobacteriota bacterium]
MAKTYDLVVIGTGSAGSTVASACRHEGWKVAIIDSRPFGGTCALRGCDPKKVLVGAAEAIDWVQRMNGSRIIAGNARIDWPELIRFKRTFTEPVPKAREEGFAKSGIATFHGRAHFVEPGTIQVGGEMLAAKHIVIATGARPAKLNIEGDEHLITSDEFLELEALPQRIVFVGGGYISFEFAHVAARAGSQVTILHRGPHGLERFDADLVDRLVKWSRQVGIDIQLETSVKSIEKKPSSLIVKTSRHGEEKEYPTDLVVHGAGRVPEIDGLDLVRGGVEHDRHGVKVNEYLQSTSNPAVYAAGDCAASENAPLTPVAGYEGRVVASNLLHGNHQKADYGSVPSVAFTIPPLAAVGLDERTARNHGLRFRAGAGDMSSWYSSRRTGETCAAYKILVEEGTERILGAHLLGSHAEEHINLFALAIRKGIQASDLKETIYSYPTHTSNTQYLIP